MQGLVRWRSFSTQVRSLLRPFLNVLPAQWLALLEFHLDPSTRASFGGAFNGQDFRRRIFLELWKELQFRAVVETGTFRGDTTLFFSENTDVPIFTVEVHPRLYHFCRLRLRAYKQVHVAHGDSREFLRKLANAAAVPKDRVFFYLDAHWRDDLPLQEEVLMIFHYWRQAVVMIDDFEVPGDEGYGSDEYEGGKRLSLDYLPSLAELHLEAFFPSASSSQESGAKRGCVILTESLTANQVTRVSTLRKHMPNSLGDIG